MAVIPFENISSSCSSFSLPYSEGIAALQILNLIDCVYNTINDKTFLVQESKHLLTLNIQSTSSSSEYVGTS